MKLNKEILKSKAINLYCEIVIEENKSIGASIDYNKLEKIEHLFRRICKVLKNRYNMRVDIDINDNLIFIKK